MPDMVAFLSTIITPIPEDPPVITATRPFTVNRLAASIEDMLSPSLKDFTELKIDNADEFLETTDSVT